METVLELKDVCFRWSKKDQATINLHELKIDQGERVFLQGESGSGKSTLLSLIGGILLTILFWVSFIIFNWLLL